MHLTLEETAPLGWLAQPPGTGSWEAGQTWGSAHLLASSEGFHGAPLPLHWSVVLVAWCYLSRWHITTQRRLHFRLWASFGQGPGLTDQHFSRNQWHRGSVRESEQVKEWTSETGCCVQPFTLAHLPCGFLVPGPHSTSRSIFPVLEGPESCVTSLDKNLSGCL